MFLLSLVFLRRSQRANERNRGRISENCHSPQNHNRKDVYINLSKSQSNSSFLTEYLHSPRRYAVYHHLTSKALMNTVKIVLYFKATRKPAIHVDELTFKRIVRETDKPRHFEYFLVL